MVGPHLQVDEPEAAEDLSPLTEAEKILRTECEADIKKKLLAFSDVGFRLHQIKSQKLYRSTHRSFEAYCKEKWGMSRVHANRQIDAHQTNELLKSEPIGTVSLAATESQARQLANLTPTEKVKVAKKVKEIVGDRAPTAKDFQQAKNEACPVAIERRPAKTSSDQTTKGKTVQGKKDLAPVANPQTPDQENHPAQSPIHTILLTWVELSGLAKKLAVVNKIPSRRDEATGLIEKLIEQLGLYAQKELRELSNPQLQEAA